MGIARIILRRDIYNNRYDVWVSWIGAIVEAMLMVIELDDF
jgi:hypothetical protein